MNFTLGLGELLSALMTVVAVGWGLLRLSFGQFERRLDAKLNAIERLELDIKRVEVDGIRQAGQEAILYATKEELMRTQEKHDKTLEHVFGLLEVINSKLDRRVDREECEKLMMRKADR